jgi:hypothetical protein
MGLDWRTSALPVLKVLRRAPSQLCHPMRHPGRTMIVLAWSFEADFERSLLRLFRFCAVKFPVVFSWLGRTELGNTRQPRGLI